MEQHAFLIETAVGFICVLTCEMQMVVVVLGGVLGVVKTETNKKNRTVLLECILGRSETKKNSLVVLIVEVVVIEVASEDIALVEAEFRG